MKKFTYTLFMFLFIFILGFIFFYVSRVYKKNDLQIINLKNERIILNKFYDYKLKLKKNLFFDGDKEFLKISNNIIDSGNLLKDQCVLNIVNLEFSMDVCEYVKKQCNDLSCSNYVCEHFLNGWYKVRYFGSFMGSGDWELIRKNKDFILNLNLDCENVENDNLDNLLFKDLLNSFSFKN